MNHFNYFIYLNWLPAFFHNAMGLNVRSSALFTFLPWVAMARTRRAQSRPTAPLTYYCPARVSAGRVKSPLLSFCAPWYIQRGASA